MTISFPATYRSRRPPFSGKTTVELQTADFKRFYSELLTMHSQVGEALSARLIGLECDFELELSSNKFGHIEGSIRLESSVYNESDRKNILQGFFSCDQSYLPGIIEKLRSFS